MIELNGALSIIYHFGLPEGNGHDHFFLWTVGCHFANSSSTWYIGSGEDEDNEDQKEFQNLQHGHFA
jgi:hypothetical protein